MKFQDPINIGNTPAAQVLAKIMPASEWKKFLRKYNNVTIFVSNIMNSNLLPCWKHVALEHAKQDRLKYFNEIYDQKPWQHTVNNVICTVYKQAFRKINSQIKG